jgi:hypothetical protein
MLSHSKSRHLWNNEILDIAMKFQCNPLKPTRSTRYLHDPTPEQTEYM